MRKRITLLLLIFSLSFNAAFIGVWIASMFIPQKFLQSSQKEKSLSMVSQKSLYQEIGLREDQLKAIEEEQVEFQDNVELLLAEKKEVRREILDLLAKEEVDENAIKAKQEKIFEIEREIQTEVITLFLSEKEMLTPAQQKRLFKKLQKEPEKLSRGRIEKTTTKSQRQVKRSRHQAPRIPKSAKEGETKPSR